MILKNKKTGEIAVFGEGIVDLRKIGCKNVAEMIETGWEDYEEPEGWWFIDRAYEPHATNSTLRNLDADREIGNYFKTKEEAEKAVEKLKAWKRLKDKGFRFEGIKEDYTRILQSQDPFRTGKRYLQFNKSEDEDWMKENWDDLDLLFGGEE